MPTEGAIDSGPLQESSDEKIKKGGKDDSMEVEEQIIDDEKLESGVGASQEEFVEEDVEEEATLQEEGGSIVLS